MTPGQVPSHPLTTRPDASVPQWLIDAYLESYINWREECAGVQKAYTCWIAATRPDRELAFAAYGEALDREEHGAKLLSADVARIRRLLRRSEPSPY